MSWNKITEQQNLDSSDIDEKTTHEILTIINNEDIEGSSNLPSACEFRNKLGNQGCGAIYPALEFRLARE